MKKRKAPTFLISALIICGIIVIMMNLPKPDPNDPSQQAQAQPQAPRTPISPSQVPSKESLIQARPMRTAANNGPVIALPQQKVLKPKPSSSDTSTLWWTNESAAPKTDK